MLSIFKTLSYFERQIITPTSIFIIILFILIKLRQTILLISTRFVYEDGGKKILRDIQILFLNNFARLILFFFNIENLNNNFQFILSYLTYLIRSLNLSLKLVSLVSFLSKVESLNFINNSISSLHRLALSFFSIRIATFLIFSYQTFYALNYLVTL